MSLGDAMAVWFIPDFMYHYVLDDTLSLIHIVLSMPCVLGFNVWGDLQLIGGRGVLDSEDFLVSNLLLPIGSIIYLLFCVCLLYTSY